MNLSCCCKHLYFVYLFISILLHSSFGLTTGDEPTEEPEEGNIGSDIRTETVKHGNSSGKHDELEARALFHSSGDAWKTASRWVGRGLRMFRESLQEGAKVAHMFKEDLDEGVTSIMRQNRGVKNDGQSQNDNENTESNSFFDQQMLREGLLGGIIRFMGINSKQVGVIALNVLIILAEWITSSMIGNNEVAGATSRMIKTNLLEWASTGHNEKLESLLVHAKSHSLPEKLIDTLSSKTGNSTSCVQLLICKMTPVIWGVQDTVKEEYLEPKHSRKEPGWRTASKFQGNDSVKEDASEPRGGGILATSQLLFDKVVGRLPPSERMLDFGDLCEQKYPQCQLLKFTTTKQ